MLPLNDRIRAARSLSYNQSPILSPTSFLPVFLLFFFWVAMFTLTLALSFPAQSLLEMRPGGVGKCNALPTLHGSI